MTQGQDVYRRVGRGGAGNFLQPKQADEASKDLEAQQTNSSGAAPVSDRLPAASSSGPALLSRAGRGGAGNYVDAASARNHEQQAAEVTAAAVAGSNSKQQRQQNTSYQPRLGGRGGAGNWQDSAAAKEDERQRLEDERRKAEELEKLAQEEVDRGLQMPARVHHGEPSRKTTQAS